MMKFTAENALAVIRMGVGFYFLTQAWTKTFVEGWLQSGASMVTSIQEDLPSSVAFYRPFLEGVVLPNATLFSQMVVLGEWVVALSLLFGVFSRLGALTGVWLMTNFILMQGLGNALTSSNFPLLLIFVAFSLTSASAVWSLDRWLLKAMGHVSILRWFTGFADREKGLRSSSSR
jgi:thiosulfate dehydrogenase (quinone) large subunit